MRLLDVRNMKFIEPPPDKTPAYAIASHRWQWGEEVFLKDIEKGRNKRKSGYKKIKGFARYVRDNIPGVDYLWADTCCIKQSSDREVSEAVNSMFRYYRDAALCIAYLADVHRADDMMEFRRSVWHTRGWTLQELLAPRKVLFLTSDWQVIGWKCDDGDPRHRPLLQATLAQITSIPEDIIANYKAASRLDFQEKLHWASRRQTTLPEDQVYSLFGVFDVAMPVIYGEGITKARRRLFTAVGEADPDLHRLPIAVLPFARQIDHVDRPELQELIERALSVKAARVALVGIRGVGKSQLALEYAYRVREIRPKTWVIWVSAETYDTIKLSIVTISRRVRIPGCEAIGIDHIALLQNWLSDEKNGAWVLMVDSSNDIETLLDPTVSTDVTRWLEEVPLCEHGSILVTGRSASQSRRFANGWQIITASPLDIEPATRLLRAKLGDAYEKDGVEHLASALARTPLELTEAATYIREHGPELTVEEYSKTIRQQSIRDAFAKMRDERKSAADLLSLMSLCDYKAIPEFLVCYEGADETPTALDEKSLQDDLQTLRSLSLISRTNEESTWQMREDTRNVIRMWLVENGTFDQYRDRLAHCLDRVAPSTGEFENWAICRRLLPHVKCAFSLGPPSKTALISWARTLRIFARYLLFQRQYEDAEPFAKAAFEIRECELGFTHLDTLRSAADFAFSYQRLHRNKEALNLLERALAVSKDMVDENHGTTLLLMDYLSSTYSSLDKHEEAVKLAQRCLELAQQVHGAKHSTTLEKMHGLARSYIDQGKFQDAADLLGKTCAAKKSLLGKGHPDTLISMHELALVMSQQRRHEEAVQLGSQVVALRTQVLGPEHLDTVLSMYNLAIYYGELGQYEQAAQVCTEVVEKYTSLLGSDHSHTLDAVKCLNRNKRKLEGFAPKKILDESQDAAQPD